jgi:uncharacterized membrane-anchored protein
VELYLGFEKGHMQTYILISTFFTLSLFYLYKTIKKTQEKSVKEKIFKYLVIFISSIFLSDAVSVFIIIFFSSILNEKYVVSLTIFVIVQIASYQYVFKNLTKER